MGFLDSKMLFQNRTHQGLVLRFLISKSPFLTHFHENPVLNRGLYYVIETEINGGTPYKYYN